MLRLRAVSGCLYVLRMCLKSLMAVSVNWSAHEDFVLMDCVG